MLRAAAETRKQAKGQLMRHPRHGAALGPMMSGAVSLSRVSKLRTSDVTVCYCDKFHDTGDPTVHCFANKVLLEQVRTLYRYRIRRSSEWPRAQAIYVACALLQVNELHDSRMQV